MKLSMDKYRFYTTENKVIAVSTYAGKSVRGIAKCDPKDKFSLEDGKKLAAARCNEKISAKRLKRANKKFAEAQDAFMKAKRHYEKMEQYAKDAQASYTESLYNVTDMLFELN